jgi:crotonobetainyl-CoA:carnitine CoA-transferase CaiB-like acyl-CoA transferase
VAYPMLEGLKGLELGRSLSAPYCGKLLTDVGAELLNSEPSATANLARRYSRFLHNAPHRERSGLVLHLNAHRQGATLHLATPTGQRIPWELVPWSCVREAACGC